MTGSVSDIIEALLGDAEAALAAGVLPKALAIYRGVLTQDPDHVLALRQTAAIMLHQDNPMAALELFQCAAKLSPGDPDLYHGVATSLRLCGHHDDAMIAYQAALRIDDAHKPALYDLGLLYRQKGNFDQAELLFRRAAAHGAGEGRFEAELQRANALFRQDRLPEAERWFHRAGILNPDDPRAFMNVAMIYRIWGHLDAAVTWLEKALALEPENPDVHWNLANTLLVRGDLMRGFAEYEWRFRRAGRGERHIPLPRWQGQDLQGKTIVLSAEQGMGDMIQFARFAAVLADRGAHVILECHPGLQGILATVPGVSQVVVLGSALPQADYAVPIMSLPHILGTTLDTIPAAIPYLSMPAGVAPVKLPGQGFRVGLVWRGNPKHENDHARSLALSVLEPILRTSGVTFISLQVGEGQNEIASLPSDIKVHDISGQLVNFAATASAVEQLDLVITVDTAVAHLAGALGKKVWILLARGNDWRWLKDRGNNPWYPTAWLFRQVHYRDWSVPVRQIVAALGELIG